VATAYASVEPVFIPIPLAEELPTVPQALEEDPDGPDEQPNLRKQSKRTNLGFSILLSAVQDYRGRDERAHNSAELLLYPGDEHYRKHLQWCCDLADLKPIWLRQTLDRLRPKWIAERKQVN
jgi:hypothetical protein